MALFDFIPSKWRNKLFTALYQYEIHDGSINYMPDDPDAYIEQGYAGNATVYSIIDRIDKMRKQAYLKLYRKMPDGQKKEVTDHELLKFTQMVNRDCYTDDFITAHLIYLLTIGEFFVYKPAIQTGVDKGKVYEIYELPSADVEIIEGTIFRPVGGYRIEGNYNTTFAPEEVYHSKLYNPNAHNERSLHGLSPLRAAARLVSKLNQGELTELRQLDNQGPPYILFKEIANSGGSIDANANRMTDPQRAELIKEIKKSGGKNTRGLPLIVKDKMGKLDLGSMLSDMNLVESNRKGMESLCAVYGLPPELFGLGQKTYNNMSTARKSAWTDCIMPNLDRVAQTFNASLVFGIEQYKDYVFDFDYSDVEELQEGIKEKVEWMTKARWTGNEIRQATGKTPTDDELMNQPIIPMGDSFLSDYSGDDLIDQDNKDFSDYKK